MTRLKNKERLKISHIKEIWKKKDDKFAKEKRKNKERSKLAQNKGKKGNNRDRELNKAWREDKEETVLKIMRKTIYGNDNFKNGHARKIKKIGKT